MNVEKAAPEGGGLLCFTSPPEPLQQPPHPRPLSTGEGRKATSPLTPLHRRGEEGHLTP
jgi:hypothetical protein